MSYAGLSFRTVALRELLGGKVRPWSLVPEIA